MRRLSVLLLLYLSAPVFAQEQCATLTHRVLEAYGCLDSLKTYPAQFQAQLSAQVGYDQSMNAAEKARFSDAITKNISADRLIKNVESSISTGCNPQQMTAVLTKVNTPLVQKMRRLEASLNTPDGAEKVRAYLESPAAKTQTEKRQRLIDDLMIATDFSNLLAATIVETSRGMMAGMGAPAASPDQIIEMRNRVQGQADQQMKAVMLAIYRNASDDELTQYLAIEQSPEFRTFNQAFGKAVSMGMGSEARMMGAALRKLQDEKNGEEQKEHSHASPAPPATPAPREGVLSQRL
jgi:hypothetical protein